MARLIFQQEGEWVRLLGPSIRAFTEFLKYGIKPASARRYDADSRAWLVHWKQLSLVANTARRYYDACDWSALPPQWQMVAVGGDPTTEEAAAPEPDENPFAMLFVTDDAPLEVIHAAYRALAKKHHSDVGGSDSEMARVNVAYERARLLREH